MGLYGLLSIIIITQSVAVMQAIRARFWRFARTNIIPCIIAKTASGFLLFLTADGQ